MVLAADGIPVRADLTIAVDVATRAIAAAVLRPVGTKAVDASLLPAEMLVPEPMRPGWAEALRMSASLLPFQRLLDIDTRNGSGPPPACRRIQGSRDPAARAGHRRRLDAGPAAGPARRMADRSLTDRRSPEMALDLR
jgi:hypothetical protein